MRNESFFSNRTNWSFTQNKITQTHQDLISKNIDIFDLTVSNPTQCGFLYPKDLLESLTNPKNFHYKPSSQGEVKVRNVIVQYYALKGVEVDPDNIFITSSTSEAYTHLFRLLANYEDEILFPAPSYPLFDFLVGLNDLKMKRYSLNYDYSWGIDFKSLESQITDRTKALVLVNPNNPTGSYVSKEELVQLNRICLKYNLALIADEVFHDFSLQKEDKFLSLAQNKDVLTCTMSGLSKVLGLPQMKLSWIVLNGPKEVVEQAKIRLDVVLDTYLSVNAPVANALKPWMASQSVIQESIQERLRTNLKVISEELSNLSCCKLYEVQGGWYVSLELLGDWDEEELCVKLLNDAHVFVHPGYFFDFSQGNFLIISLLVKENFFKEGIKRLIRCLGADVHKP
jgi:alanine-synthesizing transaminase